MDLRMLNVEKALSYLKSSVDLRVDISFEIWEWRMHSAAISTPSRNYSPAD